MKYVECPPSTPDVNPLDYIFWDLVKRGYIREELESYSLQKKTLKTKIKAVSKDSATDLKPLRKAIKQFLRRY